MAHYVRGLNVSLESTGRSAKRRGATAIDRMRRLTKSRHANERLQPCRLPRGGRDKRCGGTGARLKGRAQQANVMGLDRPGFLAFAGQMQMKSKRQQPARDRDHRKRSNLFSNTACKLHSGYVV